MKKAACLLLVFAMILSSVFVFCGCGSFDSNNSSKKTREKSDEDLIEEKVEFWGNWSEWKFMTIGGNELKSAQTNVTNMTKVSDDEYEVNGRIVMVDIYGDSWENTFDCTATLRGDSWAIGSFNYKSNTWTRK